MNDGTQHDMNKISGAIVDAALRVHKNFGPGLLEKVYEESLYCLLTKDGFHVEKQKEIPVFIEDIKLDTGFRLDLLVENTVIVEIKSTERFLPLHEAQLYTYLKLSKKPLGLLINFNVKLLKDGIKRMIMTNEM